MASVKGSNTSKTAHVMNLLSRSRGTESPLPADSAAASAALPEDAHSPQPPPILASLQNDMAVSSAIKDALQASLEDETEAPAHPSPISKPPAPSLSQENPLQNAPPSSKVPPATPPATEKDAETQPPAEPLSTPTVCETACENIMQLLVEEKADHYMGLFGLCRCSRCRNDILALALNQLPPKYVVMPVHELTPRLSIYEGRFSSAVTAQILRACKEVLEHPRHNIS